MTNSAMRPLVFLTGALTLSLVAVTARAAEPTSPHSQHALVLEAGALLSDFTTTARLDGPTGGTAVSLEDDAGLDDDQTAFRGRLQWRFANRHRLQIGFYEFDRDATRDIDRTIVVSTEDQTLEFDVGATLSTTFDWRLIPVSYAYSFVLDDKLEVAASIGLHWVDATVGFEGRAFVDGETVARGAAESEAASAPLPVVGAELNYALTPRWIVGARAQYFSLDYDDYSGDLTDIRIVTEYRLADRVGLGIGYTWFDVSFDEEQDPYRLDIDYEHDGLEAYVNFRF